MKHVRRGTLLALFAAVAAGTSPFPVVPGTPLSALAAPLSAQEPELPPADTAAGEAPDPLTEPALPGGTAEGDSLQLVDRVVAVVGDTAILLSEVRQEFVRLQAQGVEIPPAGTPQHDALADRILSAMIDRYLLLDQAKRADISVTDDEVERETERRFQQVRSNFPSPEAFQEAVEESGQNMFQYRQNLRAEARAEMLLQRFRGQLEAGGRMPPARVTEEEIAAYFEEHAARETRPATVSFHRLSVVPRPSEAAEDSALARARRALEEIRGGESFEVVARRYSEDPGSREEGGELGWLRRGDVVPAFGDAAWTARPGAAVGPVQTRFGWHIIRVENVRGGERNLRHILIRPEVGEERVEAARRLAEALADSLRAGSDPLRLAQRHPEAIEEDIRFDDVPVTEIGNRFPPEIGERLTAALPGEVVGPFESRGETGRPAFVVLELVRYRAAGRYELEDVRDTIRDRLRLDKQLERYLDELRRQTYVEVRT